MNLFVKMLILPVEMETVLSRPNFATEKRTVMMVQMKMHVVCKAVFIDINLGERYVY
jgi:hypothetical protein